MRPAAAKRLQVVEARLAEQLEDMIVDVALDMVKQQKESA
jgi:hypothetical protein